MSAHVRRLKLLELTIGGTSFECQLRNWNYDPGEQDGDRGYTFCPDGEYIDETDPQPTLQLTFNADWRAAGISRYLTENSGQIAAFQLDHHPDVVGEHVRWTGEVKLKAPPVGGEARANEMTEVTLMCVGVPEFTAVG